MHRYGATFEGSKLFEYYKLFYPSELKIYFIGCDIHNQIENVIKLLDN